MKLTDAQKEKLRAAAITRHEESLALRHLANGGTYADADRMADWPGAANGKRSWELARKVLGA